MPEFRVYTTVDDTLRLWCTQCEINVFECEETTLRKLADIAVTHECEGGEDAG